MRAQDRGDRAQGDGAIRVVAARERELELELVEAVAAREVAQPRTAGERAERRRDRRLQAVHDRLDGADVDRPPGQRLAHARTQLGT